MTDPHPAPIQTIAGREPLWSQVKNSILALIRDQALQAHAALPSENELCQRFGVSRTVVREALNQLVYQHVIYKRQGKGAFVAGRRETQDFVGSVVGFSDELIEHNRAVARRILQQRSTVPSPRAQALLRLPPGEGIESRVVEVTRVMVVEGVPRLLVSISIPEQLVPGLDQLPLQARSLYDVLRRQYGLVFHQADRWIEAVNADAEQAQLLEVSHNTPLLGIESCAYSASGQPVEYYHALYRTDMASLHIKVRP
ncbi:GntR family transcriptional regulator [Xylophilus sp. GW821-FHT01B05]